VDSSNPNSPLSTKPGQLQRPLIGKWIVPDLDSRSRGLSGVVEEVIDWDFPEAGSGRNLVVKVLPRTTPYVIIQYRTPISTIWKFGGVEHHYSPYLNVVTTVHNGINVVRGSGPVGLVIVRLRPEGAARLLGSCVRNLADAKIALDDVFKTSDVSLLAEMVSESTSSHERISLTQRFLLERLGEREPDPIASRAAARLRRSPSLRVRNLAAELGVSERHLSRRFKLMFGMDPKHFARAARVERLALMRNRGAAWADAAYACGFADQGHMINEVKALIGAAPEKAFSPDGLFAW